MSIVAVVSFHSMILPKESLSSSQLAEGILFSPLKFCVPVFLTISFLLFERGADKYNDSKLAAIKKRLYRLFIPTIFWFTIATLLKLLNRKPIPEIIGDLARGEVFTGAYYLLVIIQLIPIFILIRGWLNKKLNIWFLGIIQALVFLSIYIIPSNSYQEQILTILRSINRPLLIYWFIYIGLGIFFFKNWLLVVKFSSRINIKIKALLLIIYCVVQMIEYRWLFIRFEGNILPFDYVMFSCIISVFIMFFCFASLQETQVSSSIRDLVKILSKYSLGIFCINGIVSQIFISISTRFLSQATFSFPEIIGLKLFVWMILLFISLGLSIFLERIGLKAVVC
ncbi:hypothetical protein BC008_15130 [Mastigocoleus testarum BC008]|uniref:Acyltransferase 3 domain-containing protein n=2 Tax=Mastigocoleus TaxID=996924 RepID=A0A0V7ZGV2_9CYAN|nr:hypothetical protein BC008_14545 [Mastigocoleus testarum BC008]KST63785.1 hypothetical protein BC008_15130 [Mastigocoleus testarum BC008]